MLRVLTSLALLLLVACGVPGKKQLNRGRKDFDRGKLDKAENHFRTSLGQAREAEFVEGKAQALFHLGLTLHARADQERDEVRRGSLLRAAKEAYLEACDLWPKNGPLWNNIAQVEWDLDNRGGVAEAFEKAIEFGRQQKPFFELNLADYLLEHGQVDKAREIYVAHAYSGPEQQRAHESMMDLLRNTDRPSIAKFLWARLDAGGTLSVLDSALFELEQEGTPPQQCMEMLTVGVAALARFDLSPRRFPKTAVGRRLDALRTHAVVGDRVKSLFRITKDAEPDRGKYPLWLEHPDHSLKWDTPELRAPAFLSFIGAVANGWRKWKREKQAEDLYLFALDSGGWAPDPDILLALAELYIEQNRPDRLKFMVERFVPRAFAAKGAAYRSADLPKICKFHRALGTIYASLQQWGDGNTPASATFQLEHALEVWDRWVDDAGPTADIPAPDPKIVELLSRALGEGDPNNEKAFSMRLEYARMLMRHGYRREAQAVLTHLDRHRSQLTPAQLDQLKDLRSANAERD